MERFGAVECNYDWSRHAAFVEFRLHGQLYRFDHSVEKAKARGFGLAYRSDVFAQIVLSLESLALMAERGIYEIDTWLAGMKFLPPPFELPQCFKDLGFVEMPSRAEEVNTRFRTLAKEYHGDVGGDDALFIALQNTAKEALKHFEEDTP